MNKIRKKSLIIELIKTNGKIEKEYDYIFKLDKIRSITFESDYFNSIRLLVKDKNQKDDDS